MHQLLTHLATWPEDGRFQSHTYQKISGGANNILYKVSGKAGDFAVKFTIPRGQDERLAPRDPNWQQQGERKLAAYIQRAFSVLGGS